MGVLLVDANHGTGLPSDWRKVGCGGTSTGTTQVAPWVWHTEPSGSGGPGQTITFQATSAPSGYHSVYVNLTWDDAGTPGSSSAGVPYPGSSTAVHSLTLSTLPVGATLLSAVAQWSPNGSDIYDVLTWTAATTGRLKLWDGTQWLKEACDDEVTFADDFNRADSATTLGAPWAVVSFNNDYWGGGTAAWGITSNRAYCTANVTNFDLGATRPALAYVDLGTTDFDMSVTWQGTPDGNSYLVYRGKITDFPRARRTDINVDSGNLGFGTSFAAGDVMRLTGVGNLITLYKNGVVIFTGADTSTGTWFGMAGTSTSTTRFDDFSVTPLVTGHPLKLNVGTADAPDWVTVACMVPA